MYDCTYPVSRHVIFPIRSGKQGTLKMTNKLYTLYFTEFLIPAFHSLFLPDTYSCHNLQHYSWQIYFFERFLGISEIKNHTKTKLFKLSMTHGNPSPSLSFSTYLRLYRFRWFVGCKKSTYLKH